MITFEVTPMQLRSFVIRYIESQGLRGAVRFQIRWVGYEFGWFSKWVSNESGISFAS